ncbi:MAG: hypothetical protein J6A28_02470 [Clostridia bacterium]|nr:hypothetical protein [Clostridia bacterium]
MIKVASFVNNTYMNKKEYIEKLSQLIVNKVTFNAPITLGEEVDYSLLSAINIDVKYPIFIFKKPLNKLYYKAFLLAQKVCQFNLILTEQPHISNSLFKLLKNTFVFLSDEIGSELKILLEKLNINYLVKSNFKIKNNREYLKINNEEINFDFIPFYNHKKIMKNGIITEIKQFLLNGKNYAIDLVNTRDKNNLIDLELNIPLPQGYYLFKNKFNCIEIENLTNKDRAFFNYFAGNFKTDFSCVDGLTSCTYACINFKCQIQLKAKEKKQVFFNFGEEKFSSFTPKDVKEFFNISQAQMFEIFDTRILSRDQGLDNLFNIELPKKIWNSWNNFSYDEQSENRWLSLKGEIIKQSPVGREVSKDIASLKEVKIYIGGVWKRVFIVRGESTYLFAGRVKYFNYTLLTKEIFDKNNEIYLSFAM